MSSHALGRGRGFSLCSASLLLLFFSFLFLTLNLSDLRRKSLPFSPGLFGIPQMERRASPPLVLHPPRSTLNPL